MNTQTIQVMFFFFTSLLVASSGSSERVGEKCLCESTSVASPAAKLSEPNTIPEETLAQMASFTYTASIDDTRRSDLFVLNTRVLSRVGVRPRLGLQFASASPDVFERNGRIEVHAVAVDRNLSGAACDCCVFVPLLQQGVIRLRLLPGTLGSVKEGNASESTHRRGTGASKQWRPMVAVHDQVRVCVTVYSRSAYVRFRISLDVVESGDGEVHATRGPSVRDANAHFPSAEASSNFAQSHLSLADSRTHEYQVAQLTLDDGRSGLAVMRIPVERSTLSSDGASSFPPKRLRNRQLAWAFVFALQLDEAAPRPIHVFIPPGQVVGSGETLSGIVLNGLTLDGLLVRSGVNGVQESSDRAQPNMPGSFLDRAILVREVHAQLKMERCSDGSCMYMKKFVLRGAESGSKGMRARDSSRVGDSRRREVLRLTLSTDSENATDPLSLAVPVLAIKVQKRPDSDRVIVVKVHRASPLVKVSHLGQSPGPFVLDVTGRESLSSLSGSRGSLSGSVNGALPGASTEYVYSHFSVPRVRLEPVSVRRYDQKQAVFFFGAPEAPSMEVGPKSQEDLESSAVVSSGEASSSSAFTSNIPGMDSELNRVAGDTDRALASQIIGGDKKNWEGLEAKVVIRMMERCAESFSSAEPHSGFVEPDSRSRSSTLSRYRLSRVRVRTSELDSSGGVFALLVVRLAEEADSRTEGLERVVGLDGTPDDYGASHDYGSPHQAQDSLYLDGARAATEWDPNQPWTHGWLITIQSEDVLGDENLIPILPSGSWGDHFRGSERESRATTFSSHTGLNMSPSDESHTVTPIMLTIGEHSVDYAHVHIEFSRVTLGGLQVGIRAQVRPHWLVAPDRFTAVLSSISRDSPINLRTFKSLVRPDTRSSYVVRREFSRNGQTRLLGAMVRRSGFPSPPVVVAGSTTTNIVDNSIALLSVYLSTDRQTGDTEHPLPHEWFLNLRIDSALSIDSQELMFLVSVVPEPSTSCQEWIQAVLIRILVRDPSMRIPNLGEASKMLRPRRDP